MDSDSKREASSLMGTHAQLTSPSRSGENSRTPADGCDSESQSQTQNPAPDPAIVLRRKKIREAMGPKYVQLLVLAKGLEYILPRYPDLESLIIQPFYEERKLCDLMEEDEEAVLAKVNVIRTELGTYEDKLLETFEKLQAYPGEEPPQNLSEENNAKQKPLQLLSQAELREKLRSFCQGARRKTLLDSTRGCQELWKQYERECESLCPDGVQFEVQDGVSAMTKTRGRLSTRLQAVSEAARRSCLLEERVQLVSSQTDWLCGHLTSPDMTADLPSCRVRFLRVFQRLLFLTGVCNLIAQ